MLVVFDLDGTLVDATRDIATAVNVALGRAAPDLPQLAEPTVRAFIGEGVHSLLARVSAHVGRPQLAEALFPAYVEAYGQHLLDTTRAYPGVAQTLDTLRLRGHRLAVLTNKPGDFSRAILAGLGLATCFTRVLGGGDGVPRKPDPAGLLRLVAEHEVTPRQTVLVGDSAIDVATGRAAGVTTIGLSYGLDPDGLRAARPALLLDDFRALTAVLADRSVLG
jgi:phosphoglycolate phosphatase